MVNYFRNQFLVLSLNPEQTEIVFRHALKNRMANQTRFEKGRSNLFLPFSTHPFFRKQISSNEFEKAILSLVIAPLETGLIKNLDGKFLASNFLNKKVINFETQTPQVRFWNRDVFWTLVIQSVNLLI